jgi:hypothetical protein
MGYTTASVSLALAASLLVGCQSTHTAWPSPRPISGDLDEAVMTRLTSLDGQWEMMQEDGSWGPGPIFAVSSNGSVVREIMFPGMPHEMTNLYHMDGGEAVATHYCAVGNQPRMTASRVEQTADGPSIDYTFDSVSNFRDSHPSVMGGLRLTFVDEDTLHQRWTSYNAEGEQASDPMTFILRRKP